MRSPSTADGGDLVLELQLALLQPCDHQVVAIGIGHQRGNGQVQIVMLGDQMGQPPRDIEIGIEPGIVGPVCKRFGLVA